MDGMNFYGAIDRVNDIHDNQHVEVHNHYSGDMKPPAAVAPARSEKKAEEAKKPVGSVFAEAITALMAEQVNGDYLFKNIGHWAAIYAVLLDRGEAVRGDYEGFKEYLSLYGPGETRVAFSSDTMQKAIREHTVYDRPLSQWSANKYDGERAAPFHRMKRIGERFDELLREMGA